VAEQNSALSFNLTVQDLLTAGLHFGHQTKRWNPKMKRFIFGKKNGIFVIDLEKTLLQLKAAQEFIYNTVSRGNQVLFVGTKRQAQLLVKNVAESTKQHYVISRWLGGGITNFGNITNSIKRLKCLRELMNSVEAEKMPQKEASRIKHELSRLERNLSGMVNMEKLPGAIVVIDVNKEAIVIKEANKAGIPIVALVDTNSDPDPITYPVPGNDDSVRSIKLFLDVIAEAITKANAIYESTAAQRAAEQATAQNQQRESAGYAGSSQQSERQMQRRRPLRRGDHRGGRVAGRSIHGGMGRGKKAPGAKQKTETENKGEPEVPTAEPKTAENSPA
jgi:small subunit ribosomal protein S2